MISGLYNLVPEKVGPVDELAQSSENFDKQTENWHGVDLNVVARLRAGLTVQGGTSTGRRLADGCDVRAKLPELGAGPTGYFQPIRHGDRRRDNGGWQSLGDQPLLPPRRALQDGLQGACDVYDSESGCPGERDVGQHPWRPSGGELRGK